MRQRRAAGSREGTRSVPEALRLSAIVLAAVISAGTGCTKSTGGGADGAGAGGAGGARGGGGGGDDGGAGDAAGGGDDGGEGDAGGQGGEGDAGGQGGEGGSDGGGAEADAEALLTFVVVVPANTPPEDNVYLQSGPFVAVKMTRVDAVTWALAVPLAQIRLGPERDAGPFARGAYEPDTMQIDYAYTRGQSYFGGEYFPDDPGNDAWNVHRHASAATPATVDDRVQRWRWFPADGEILPRYDATPTAFGARIPDWTFMAGLELDDLWTPELVPVIPTTHAAAKRIGADTIELAPPWDYTSVDPLPVIGNAGPDKGQYTDEALGAQLAAIRDDGLRVLLQPQICCTAMPANVSPGWVDAWFAQYQAFFVHHAMLAEQAGVEALLMDWSGARFMPGQPDAPVDAEARWKTLIAAVRAAFKGKLGFNLLIFQQAGQRDAPTFWLALQPLAAQFDFLGMSLWQGFATTKDATQADIDAEVEATFAARMDPVHAASQLPHILTQVAYGSFDGAAIGDLGVDDVALPTFGPEMGATLVYDGVEQAKIYQAVLRAVAARPHVVGVFPFLTHYVALPKAPDQCIRGKAAEGVLSAWYAAAPR